MKKFLWFSALVLVLLFAVSCSSGNSSSKKDDVTPDEDSDAESVSDDDSDKTKDDEKDDEDNNNDSEPARPPLECADFAEGLNENLIVGEGGKGLARNFILRLPKEIDSDKEFPVIFIYHGYGDTADNFEQLLNSYVDNETMPFILVVPESRSDKFGFDNIPPSGLDWDMMNLTDGNAEADMFDAVLECLGKKWKIDEKHVHVSGFSAGAITANSIALQRPEKVASILSYSGAYFSDEKSRDALGDFMGMAKIGDFFSWPDFAEGHNKYPQVFVFGDKEKDSWSISGIFTIYFNQMGRLGANYLTENGHEAILCEHDQDHDVAGISSESMIKFFAAHPFGTEKSSYREEMPEDFAGICHFFTEKDLEGLDDGDDDDSDDENDDDDADSANDEENDGADSNNDDEPEDPDAPLTCENFKEGLNKNLIVGEGENKLEREFILHRPNGIDSDKKFPVVFLYHGYGDTAENFDNYFSSYVENEEMPFILVVPESRGDKFNLDDALSPTGPTGLEWDMVNLEDGNAEAAMFDKILTCLEKNIDEKHIHLIGYSAGAVAADGIALQRNDRIASVVSISGAYFSNDKNREALGTIPYQGMSIAIGDYFKWPDFEKNHTKYPQLFIFGKAGEDFWKAEGDYFDIGIDFNQMANNDGTYFHENGHDAILCNHGGNHSILSAQAFNSGAMQKAVLKFLKDHPSGTNPSPYQENLPTEFASMDCSFVH